MQYRFFKYHFGAEYVKCKKVKRNGAVFFRTEMGEEMPAHRTAKDLYGQDRDAYVRSYNSIMRNMVHRDNLMHPENKTEYKEMTYEEILESIRALY